MDNVDLYETFQGYLRDELPLDEKLDFEKLLDSNVEIRLEYEAFVTSHVVVESLVFGDRVKEIIESKKNKGNRKWIINLAIGTAAVFVIGVFIFRPKEENPRELFAKYFEVAPDLFSSRSSENSEELNLAMNAYNSGDFTKSSELLTRLKTNDTILLYRGVSYLATDMPSEALASLYGIKSVSLENERNWYLLLGHLLLSSKDSVNYYLRILQSNSDYGNQVESIRAKLINY